MCDLPLLMVVTVALPHCFILDLGLNTELLLTTSTNHFSFFKDFREMNYFTRVKLNTVVIKFIGKDKSHTWGSLSFLDSIFRVIFIKKTCTITMTPTTVKAIDRVLSWIGFFARMPFPFPRHAIWLASRARVWRRARWRWQYLKGCLAPVLQYIKNPRQGSVMRSDEEWQVVLGVMGGARECWEVVMGKIGGGVVLRGDGEDEWWWWWLTVNSSVCWRCN